MQPHGKGGKPGKADKKAERVRAVLAMYLWECLGCKCSETVTFVRTASCRRPHSQRKSQCIGCCLQAAARAKQAEVPTQPDPSDPLGSQYGDAKLVRSESISGRKWTPINTLTPELKDQTVSLQPLRLRHCCYHMEAMLTFKMLVQYRRA